MTTKEIVLTVPTTFKTPSYLASATPEQTVHALLLADAILEKGSTMTNDTTVRELREQIKLLKTTTVESCLEEAQRISKAEIKVQVSEKEIQLRDKEAQLRDKDSHIQDLRSQLERVTNEKSKLNEQYIEALQQIHDKKLALANPQKKGVIGELVFQELAMKVMGWKLEATGNAHKHHQTDWKFKYNDVNVYFEIKKYEESKNKKEKAVPHEQYEKFVNDMNRNLEIDIGFYISLDIPIAFTNEIKMEFTASNQMLVVVPNFLQSEDEIPVLFHQFALYMLAAKHYRKLLQTMEVDEKNNTKLQRLSTYITNMNRRIKTGKKEYDSQKEQLQQAVDNIKQYLDAFFASLLQDAASTFAILCDDEKYVEDTEETEQPLNLPNLAKEKKKRNTKAKAVEA